MNLENINNAISHFLRTCCEVLSTIGRIFTEASPSVQSAIITTVATIGTVLITQLYANKNLKATLQDQQQRHDEEIKAKTTDRLLPYRVEIAKTMTRYFNRFELAFTRYDWEELPSQDEMKAFDTNLLDEFRLFFSEELVKEASELQRQARDGLGVVDFYRKYVESGDEFEANLRKSANNDLKGTASRYSEANQNFRANIVKELG